MIYDLESIEHMAKVKRVTIIGDIDEDVIYNLTRALPIVQPGTELWISSYGGEAEVMRAIIDLINATPNIDKVIGNGYLLSAAAVIFLAVKRPKYMTESSRLMVHKSHMERIARKASEFATGFIELQELNDYMRTILVNSLPSKHTKEIKEVIENFDNETDVYIDVDHCLKWKIIDGIYRPEPVTESAK